ncbi:MAG: hypothetical protein PUH25_01550 [Spirochaetales bacterium]|uniref:hypothetical protein n=1 Tax=Bullifex sp. TaxID=2815808 RepID=UPI002A51A947|nr:hypothetical protein [Bullifex sp.]MDD7270541.1 hypothetical protein [Spirochaetales bacterium]MDY4066863.1 hypothetical protein [Bullifex sp.]
MKKRILLYCVIVLLILTSCTHTHEFKDGYYFQAMGEDSEIIVTVDTQKAREVRPTLLGVNDSLLSSILDKSSRISVSLSKDEYIEDDPYPADIASMNISGAIEGDYSKFIINTGLGFSKDFSKVKEDGVKYYTNSENSIELGSPTSGVILFSNDSYKELYDTTIKNRVIKISDEKAALIGESVMGLYVRSPQTMIALGFEIPLSVIVQMSDAVIYVVEKDSVFYLYADITMKSSSLAKTLNTLLRNQVVAEIKRQGEKPDFKVLGQQYYTQDDKVLIRDRVMNEAELTAFEMQLKVASGSII